MAIGLEPGRGLVLFVPFMPFTEIRPLARNGATDLVDSSSNVGCGVLASAVDSADNDPLSMDAIVANLEEAEVIKAGC